MSATVLDEVKFLGIFHNCCLSFGLLWTFLLYQHIQAHSTCSLSDINAPLPVLDVLLGLCLCYLPACYTPLPVHLLRIAACLCLPEALECIWLNCQWACSLFSLKSLFYFTCRPLYLHICTPTSCVCSSLSHLHILDSSLFFLLANLFQFEI